MPSLKTLPRFVIFIGIVCIVIGFLSVFFFQITHSEIDLNGSHTSDIFYLNGGKTYSIAAVGANYAFGSGGGEIIFHSRDGGIVRRFHIYFSFDGDSDTSTIIIGDFKVPSSGNYYFQYIEDHNTIYGPVKIKIQESFVESIIGIKSLDLLIIGVVLIVGGSFLPFVSQRIGRRISMGAPERDDESFETEPASVSMDDFDTASPLDVISCPTCGNVTDGIHCEQCGLQLRELG